MERPAGTRDRAFMRRALVLARKGWGRTAPNPMVGAVVVRDDVIAGEGWHAEYGQSHAEPMALASAGTAARGATMYVSLEPCAHHGKTPPCVDAIIAAGIARVVIAVRDPNSIARGGLERLGQAGIETTVGVEEAEALELNAAFFHDAKADRPFVRLKLAVSIDGAISDATRTSGWLTGKRARRLAHRMRADSDAVAVGIGTALADDPLLTVRDVPPPRVPPVRVVFDRQARLPLTSALVRSAHEAPVVVVTSDVSSSRVCALVDAGVQTVVASSMREALSALRARRIRSILVEGGAGIAGALLDESLVDRLVIFQAPIVLGAGALGAWSATSPASITAARRWRIVEHRNLAGDTLTIYARPAG